MADRLEQLIEMECADALLDSGVSVPLKKVEAALAETSRGDACDDEAAAIAGADIAGQGIPEDGCQARLAAEGQGGGTGLCGGAWSGSEPAAGLYGMPGLRVVACGYRSDGLGTAELRRVALSDGHVPDI